MAYFHREIEIAVEPSVAWSAMRDVGALHTRLVRGFVADCVLDGDVRTVTFANGVVAAERMIAVSEDEHRVSWSATGNRLSHHNASARLQPRPGGGSRIVWEVDLLPDAMAPAIAAMVEAGLAAMKATLESDGAVA